MLRVATDAFILKSQPLTHFDFPRWQAVVAISLIGALVGLDPALRDVPIGMPALPVGWGLALGLLTTWVNYGVAAGVLRWWLCRAERWDGKGRILHILAATWLLPNLLSALLMAFGVPLWVALPLWLYAVWIVIHATRAAIPQIERGYLLVGVVFALLASLLAVTVAFFAIGIILALGGRVAP